MNDTTRNRLLYNEDGETLDEIVAVGTDIHVEQMDDHLYWMRVGESHFHFRAEPHIAEDEDPEGGGEVVKVRVRFTLDDEAAGEYPLSQRHKTQAEMDEDQRFLVAVDAGKKRDRIDPDWYVTLRGEKPAADSYYKGGSWHRRTVELLGLLSDAAKVQREPCDHTGIGRPGCVTCDPRVRDAIGVGSQVVPNTIGGKE